MNKESTEEIDFNKKMSDALNNIFDNPESSHLEPPPKLTSSENTHEYNTQEYKSNPKVEEEYSEDKKESPEIIIIDDEELNENQPPPSSEELIDKKKYVAQKKKLSALQRERYQAAEREKQLQEAYLRAEQEKEILRSQIETASNAASYHYDDKLNLEYEKLSEDFAKAQALEDSRGMASIAARLGAVETEKRQREKEKAVESIRMQQMMAYNQQYNYPQHYAPQYPYQPQYPQQEEPVAVRPETEEWINKNTWFVEDHPDFDQDKFDDTRDYIAKLDNYLVKSGRAHEVETDSYFASIDNFVSKKFSKGNGQLSMNRSPNAVAPVRRSSSGNYENSQSPTRVKLTSEEKDMAKRLGVTNEFFAKYKLEDMRKIQQARDLNDSHQLERWGFRQF